MDKFVTRTKVVIPTSAGMLLVCLVLHLGRLTETRRRLILVTDVQRSRVCVVC
jgi:hypothetical protein